MHQAPTEDLIRGIAPIRAADEGRTMIGYPVVFNQWTEIHSWEGDFLERVAPTAVDRTLEERGDRVKVQYNHGMHPVVGTSGLGRPRVMRTDKFGLYTETPLSDTSYNRDIIIPQLADQTLDGMSFRFSVVGEEWHDPDRATKHNPDRLAERTLLEIKVPEFGPVDMPAYEATQVGIRSAAGLEKWLQTSPEERQEFTRRFGITHEPHRLVVPGFSPPEQARSEEVADTGASDSQVADTGACEPDPKKARRDKKWEHFLARRTPKE